MTRIAIDPSRPVGRLDRKVFGGFVEHLGRCIYGGLYEEGSPLSDDRGFRKDVLGLLRELQLGVLRWPGGNFVSNYHWADGIGPKDSRPRRPELAWGGEESNRFGTDEYLVDVHVTGPVVGPDLAAGPSRWPHRVADLGPFSLVDAAATVSANNVSANSDPGPAVNSGLANGGQGQVAVTLVNRSPDETVTAEVLLRDHAFDGAAVIRTVTAGTREQSRVLPDVATANLEEGSVTTANDRVVIALPPQSFTVLEAALKRR